MKEEKIEELRGKIYESYIQRTIKSKEMSERACTSLAGGVCGNLRYLQPYPLYMARGKGSKIWDVDGNEYIDCFLNNGPLLLGHCHPEVMEEIRRESEKGLLIYNWDLCVRCAESLKEVIPCAERVRFANSGTEAVMFAVRVARAFTGRNKIIKFYGHYHGQDDPFLIGTSTINDQATSLGVPQANLINTILSRYGCVEEVTRKLNEEEDIAGIILDPQMSMGGIFPAGAEYLRELRSLTRERGILLIFDEVITGFRLALGGAQEYFGITPDLACYAKGVAAGAKFAAVVGKKEIMDSLVPGRPVTHQGDRRVAFQSGTYNDGVEGIAGAIAAIRIYKRLSQKGEYGKLHEKTKRLAKEIEGAFKERKIGCHVNYFGSCLKMFITDLEPSFEAYSKLNHTVRFLFLLDLVNQGILLSWPSLGSVFLSFVHTDKDLERIIEGVNMSLEKYKFEEVL